MQGKFSGTSFTRDSLEVQGKFSGIASLETVWKCKASGFTETVWKCKASLVVLLSRQFGSARQV